MKIQIKDVPEELDRNLLKCNQQLPHQDNDMEHSDIYPNLKNSDLSLPNIYKLDPNVHLP